MRNDPWLCPWSAPTALTPADGYRGSAPGLEYLAVDTAPTPGGAHAVPDARQEEVLWSDLQAPVFGSYQHIGSGRSGFYGGKYLKGIGRTAIAHNWARGEDAYHASGHLFASGAIREHLVSVLLEAAGAGHTIVPCEAVLLRRMPSELRTDLDAHFAAQDGLGMAPIDRELQAISVKPGGFARLTNMLWFASRLRMPADDAPAFCWMLQEFAQDPRDEFDGERTPETVVAALMGAAERTLANFETFFRLGVYWSSVANNFTLDGRFLDLELPTVTGRRFFGGIECSADREEGGTMGLVLTTGDFIEAVAYLRRGLARLEHALRGQLLDGRDSPKHALVRDLCEGLAQQRESHVLYDDEALLGRLHELFVGVRAVPANLAEVLRGEFNQWVLGKSGAALEPSLVEAPVTLARTESMVRSRLRVHAVGDSGAWQVAREFNDSLRDLDETPALDEALEKLERAVQRTRELGSQLQG